MVDLFKLNLLTFGKTHEPDPDNPGESIHWVYQRVKKGLGQRYYSSRHDIQRRRWVQTPDPKTPAKLALQARIRDAVAAWQALTPFEKEQWRKPGQPRRLPAYNAFISAWCKTHPIDIPSLLPKPTYVRYPRTLALWPNGNAHPLEPAGIGRIDQKYLSD